MKIIFLLLGCSICTGTSQVVADYALRRFGTNVYDFSLLMRSRVTNSSYLVAGEVFQAGRNSACIVRKKIEVVVSREFQREMLLAGPGEQLKMLFVMQLVQRPGGIGAGEFNALSPDTKQMYLAAREQKVDYVRVFVTNCPAQYLVPGKQVRFFAIPTGTATFTDAEGGTQSLPRYDYGQPFFGDSKTLSNVFLVTAQGFVKKESPQEAAAKKAATTANLIAWQHQQASNGVARSQYDLAKRYLDGNGVTKDGSLGRYWLSRSAAQDYEPALKLLETQSGVKPK